MISLATKKRDQLNGLKRFSLVSANTFNDDQTASLKKKLNELGHESIELKQFVDPAIVLGLSYYLIIWYMT